MVKPYYYCILSSSTRRLKLDWVAKGGWSTRLCTSSSVRVLTSQRWFFLHVFGIPEHEMIIDEWLEVDQSPDSSNFTCRTRRRPSTDPMGGLFEMPVYHVQSYSHLHRPLPDRWWAGSFSSSVRGYLQSLHAWNMNFIRTACLGLSTPKDLHGNVSLPTSAILTLLDGASLHRFRVPMHKLLSQGFSSLLVLETWA